MVRSIEPIGLTRSRRPGNLSSMRRGAASRRERKGTDAPEPTSTAAQVAAVLQINRQTLYGLARRHPDRVPPFIRSGWKIVFLGVGRWMERQVKRHRRKGVDR